MHGNGSERTIAEHGPVRENHPIIDQTLAKSMIIPAFSRFAAVLVASAALVSGSAAASSLTFAGGTNATLIGVSGTFNPNWWGGFTPGDYNLTSMQQGGTLSLSGPANVTYTFVGREAAYNNLFRSFVIGDLVDGQQIKAGTNPLGTSITFTGVTGGMLNFGFKSQGTGTLFGNGSVSTGLILGQNGQSGLILFNDTAGDKDFDDMVIRVSVTPVPEPETFAMLLAGLGLMGAVARRRRQSA